MMQMVVATPVQDEKTRSELLSAAELLLSVSPMFKPQAQHRDRSWSMQSLETLVDVATRSEFSIGPAAKDRSTGAAGLGLGAGVGRKMAAAVCGRSLLQPKGLAQSQTSSQSNCKCGSKGNCKHGGRVQSRILQVAPTAKPAPAGRAQASASSASAPARTGSLPMLPEYPSVLPAKFRPTYFRDGRIGIYTQAQRRQVIDRFLRKRGRRVWTKKVRYSCRKNLAKQRIRIKGRFVKTTEQLHARPELDE